MSDTGKAPTVCTDHHLAYLLGAALHLAETAIPRSRGEFRWETTLLEEMVLTPESFQWTGQMLRERNENSVREWTREPLPVHAPFNITGYTLRQGACFRPVEIIRAARHYADQTVFARGWPGSHAWCFIQQLTEAAIRQIPGYGSAHPEGPPAMHIFLDLETR